MEQCKGCDIIKDLRLGYCFKCASAGEEQAAKRTVIQHIKTGAKQIFKRNFNYARIEFIWAFERMTKTGDYRHDGTFDREGYDWK